jgi:hypothetical protein
VVTKARLYPTPGQSVEQSPTLHFDAGTVAVRREPIEKGHAVASQPLGPSVFDKQDRSGELIPVGQTSAEGA